MFWQYWDKAFQYDFDWRTLQLIIFGPNLGQKEISKKIIRSWGKNFCFPQVGVIKSKLGLVSKEQEDQKSASHWSH